MVKILFLVQEPNKGGLKNFYERLANILKKKKGINIKIKIINKESFELEKYDVVHLFFSPFFSKKLLLNLLKIKRKKKKPKIFLTYYNLKKESKLKLFIKKKILYLSIDKLILPSERMVNYYKKIGFKNSFLLKPLIPDNLKKYHKKKKSKISYFGALREDKGISRIIKISEWIPESINVAGFKVGGKSSEKYYSLIKSNKNILLYRGNPFNLMAETKIAIFPYKNLNSTIDLPLALLESMSSGAPVLTSNIPPLNQFLPKECLVDDWDSREEVIAKINYLKKNSNKISKKMIEIIKKLRVDEKTISEEYIRLFS